MLACSIRTDKEKPLKTNLRPSPDLKVGIHADSLLTRTEEASGGARVLYFCKVERLAGGSPLVVSLVLPDLMI